MATRYALALLICFSSLFAQAEHLPGGTLSTRCVGGNFHEITLKLFRDCSGTAMIPQELSFSNDCGVNFTQTGLVPVSVEEVSPLCAEDLPNSTCNGGTLIGFELYTYQATVFLSPCDSWRISWAICCRNTSLNVLANPGLYMETSVNNAGGFCNAGPEFVDNTIPLVCVGQPVSYDASATDADGHSLRYQFIDARFAAPAPTPVNYRPPYNGAEPIDGMQIDSLTGRITFTPQLVGLVVTVVEVNEYDSLGRWVGTVMRDFPFFVSPCENSVPDVDAGNFSNATGVAVVSGDRDLIVCTEGAFCATMQFTDSDAEQSLEITSNINTVMPGATIELNGSNPVTAEVCWNSTGVATGVYQFSITATDDACPVEGFQQFAYTIAISNGASAGEGATVDYCLAEPEFDLLPLLGGAPGPNGEWTGPDGEPTSDLFDPSSSEPGNYTYTVSSGSECEGSAVLTMNLLPESDPACVFLSVTNNDPDNMRILADPNTPGLFRLFADRQGKHRIDVIGMDGRVVITQQQVIHPSGTPLDISALRAGVYLIRATHSESGAIHAERILKP